MRSGIIAYALAFLLGICCLQSLSFLPDDTWLFLLPVCLCLILLNRLPQCPVVFATGFLWALFQAHSYHDRLLAEELVGQDIWVEGLIASIPVSKGRLQRFNFRVTDSDQSGISSGHHLRLSWYNQKINIKSGETWRLKLRLKPPHGLMNPGGFDYERWLYQQKIHATGYVRRDKNNRLLAAASWFDINRYRQYLLDQLSRENRQPFNDLIAALSVGHKGLMSEKRWQVLTQTGTNHLMAISGLHIGLVAGMVFWLVRRFAPAWTGLTIPGVQLAALVSLMVGASTPCWQGLRFRPSAP